MLLLRELGWRVSALTRGRLFCVMAFVVAPIGAEDRAAIGALFRQAWGDTFMVSRGRRHNVAELGGWIARDRAGQIVGVVTCRGEEREAEIVSLDSLREGQGIGSALVAAVVARAWARGLARVWLVTTNDNLLALGFWQRRGFDLVALHRGAVEEARRLKPAIPLVGHGGIGIRHELELEICP